MDDIFISGLMAVVAIFAILFALAITVALYGGLAAAVVYTLAYAGVIESFNLVYVLGLGAVFMLLGIIFGGE